MGWRLACALVLLVSTAVGEMIVRTVELTATGSQIFVGGFGNGVFWRPTFDIAPFEAVLGDRVEVTLWLTNRVEVVAGIIEQESVLAAIVSGGGTTNSNQRAAFEFLWPTGDLLLAAFSILTASEGAGIGANFNPLDISDETYSFGGVRFAFDILSSTRGLPALFLAGVVSVQTQGAIRIVPISEPGSLLTALAALLINLGKRRLRPKHQWRRAIEASDRQQCVGGEV